MLKRFRPPKRDLYLERMFETRSEAWERAGLSVGDASEKSVTRARRQAIVLTPLLVAVLVGYGERHRILGETFKVTRHGGHWTSTVWDTPVQVLAVVALVAIGWTLASAIGKAAGPTFMRRMDPATAGTVGFLIRLGTFAITLGVALSVAGLNPQTLAVGGAFTAVVLGLAAQQTLGNVIAGMVLLSARPFRVGERIRLQAGAVGGSVEGIVSSLGLLYTTLARGDDRVLVPNNVVLAAAVVPLKEPDSVDVKVTLTSGVSPSQVQAILDNEISTPTLHRPSVLLEELEGSELVVRIQATPELADDGAKLADEIIAALASVTGEHPTEKGRAEPGLAPADPASPPDPRRQRRQRCPRWRSAIWLATSWAPSRRLTAAAIAGASPAAAAPSRSDSGATSNSALSVSIARSTAAATCSDVRVPTPRGSCSPVSANMPASRMKPGRSSTRRPRARAGPRGRRARSPAARTWSPNTVTRPGTPSCPTGTR